MLKATLKSHMQDEVFERFNTRLQDLGLKIDNVDEDGLIHIDVGEETLRISLDNVRKSYQQDGTFDHLDNLIESIHSYLMEVPIPDWEEAKANVYVSLFPSSHDFADFINEPVTGDFNTYYLYHDGKQYTWLNKQQLEDWSIDEITFKKQVEVNMNTLLEASTIETMTLENGATLAYFETEIEELKSALLLSRNLKEKISSILGWPIYSVLPVRDFCYMFSLQDKDILIDLLGATVVKEYNESGYEITKEIIEISDDGINAIGKYDE
jgi:hypothetical protein